MTGIDIMNSSSSDVWHHISTGKPVPAHNLNLDSSTGIRISLRLKNGRVQGTYRGRL